MQKTKTLLLSLVAAVMLTGCGHGFEGDYSPEFDTGDTATDKQLHDNYPDVITIGDNYVEADGERDTYDEVKVRDTDEGKLLVFKKGDKEENWKIVDNSTLEQNTAYGGTVTLNRQ